MYGIPLHMPGFSIRFVTLSAALGFLASCTCAPGVTCTQPRDCVDESKPYCAPALGACVQCIEDQQCGEGKVCNTEGKCEVGCNEHSCPLGKACKPGTGCVDCLTDSQCGAGKVCKQNTCVPGCSRTNPNCPNTMACDVDAGSCVGCVTNTNCLPPGPPVCDPTTHTCVECTTGTDCRDPQHPVCNPSTNTCVECTGDTECPAGKVCQTNVCVPGCNANHPCPMGSVCNGQGQCVQCVDDNHCSGTTPRCDQTTHTCVPCLPGSGDNCPMGQYCRPDKVCERGCKTGADCPGGVCLPDHSCQQCTDDKQCAAGSVCQNGTCVAACSANNPCGTGRDCCNGHCEDTKNDAKNCGTCGLACGANGSCCNGNCRKLDTANDCGACGVTCSTTQGCCGAQCIALNTLQNCGACGNACGPDQFCDGIACRNQVFPEFCANTKVYAIRDGNAPDDTATNMLASTILQYCSSQTHVEYGPQTNPAWVDQDAGTLLLGGGSTVVTAGGPFPNKPVKWLERTRQVTKVYFDTNKIDTFYFKKRSDSSVLVTRLQSWCTPNRDVFVVELATDPISGTLALVSYGLCSGDGTQTGAWYWANVMLPNRNQYTDSWYLYEWTDTNTNGQADSTDTYTKLGSGR